MAQATGIRKQDLVQVLLDREILTSTGIGRGIGVPHGRMKQLDEPTLGFGISRDGVDFESIDNEAAHLYFILLSPEEPASRHLSMLARISRLLKNDEVKQSLEAAENREAVIQIIQDEEEDL